MLAVAVAWLLLVPAADWLAHHDVGSAKGPPLQAARDAARGRLLTLGAGLFAAAALFFTALNFNLLRRTSEKTDQWQRRTYELTEQGQVTDRYTKAIDQLGSDKLDVRIGGIYALERVARDSAADHPTVMEVLTAFIREHSRERWPPPDPDGQKRARSIRPDVQAAVTVVGRRGPERDIQPIDLTLADLGGADLTAANLRGAKLFGVDLTSADLTRADLTRADLMNANLAATNLTGADLTDADLDGADLGSATLTGADLTRASLCSVDFGRANLTGVTLTGADLSGAQFIDANLSGADLTGAMLIDVDLSAADLTRTDLTGADWHSDMAAPDGWQLDADSLCLERSDTDQGEATAD